jgi:hypothetical protein
MLGKRVSGLEWGLRVVIPLDHGTLLLLLNSYQHREGSSRVTVDELIDELAPSTVPGAQPVGHPFSLPTVTTAGRAKGKLTDYFEKNPGVQAVDLVIAGHPAGVVSRKSLSRNAGRMAGDSPAAQVGAGEGMQLPGFSTRYRLLEFACQKHVKGCQSEHRIHYDERDIPTCRHGPMKLVPR